MLKRTRVLIIDDSAIVRKILSESLAGEPDLEVVGTAPDPYVARDKVLQTNPDVLTLDIEMPRMDGLTFLEKLMRFHPLPVVVISSLTQRSSATAVRAMELGAIEVLAKPGGPYSVGELASDLANKVRAAAAARIQRRDPAPPAAPVIVSAASGVIAIGASTGGTDAISQILTRLPAATPGLLIAQHIPAGFSRAFARRLNDICAMEVREAADGDAVCRGLALIAPGDFHMMLRKRGEQYSVAVQTCPRVCYQRPSVDVLFESVAEAAGREAVGVLLTGMGSDGARGLLHMREAGARTIAQDEATCIVYGMPRKAVEMGAAGQVLPLPQIAQAML